MKRFEHQDLFHLEVFFFKSRFKTLVKQEGCSSSTTAGTNVTISWSAELLGYEQKNERKL